MVKTLLDTGSGASCITKKCATKLKVKTVPKTTFTTAAGRFSTNKKAKTQFFMPEFSDTKLVEHEMHVVKELGGYDMIIGRDLMRELKISISFEDETMLWDGVVAQMKSVDANAHDFFLSHESDSLDDAAQRIDKILEAKYEKANLEEIVQNSDHLKQDEKRSLLPLLKRYEDLFDGTLGRWHDDDYDIELKPDAQPYHARSYPIPKVYEKTLRHEVDRLCKLGVLKKVNRSEWAAPTFIIPKKDKTVRFISDFRELNKRIKRKPYPIPKIQDIMQKLEGFRYATTLDLNMGYYHIELSPAAKRLCTIVLPWGKYEYQKLPMGLSSSVDVFQEKMSTLMSGLEFVRAYLDDICVISSDSWQDHLDKLELVLKRLREAGLKVNAKKSIFGTDEMEYLGYWVTRNGIQPVSKKVQAIMNLETPKTKRQVRRLIGMVNYYRDMWHHRSHILAPLTKLTSKITPWKWTSVEQEAFEQIKKVVSRETLLSFPNFEETFDIHTDASDTQLGAVISQGGKPIAFYSRKLADAQKRYTTTERELLSIVETLKEFRNILFGQKIRIFTDHQNLTYKNFNTDRVMRWRLLIEEYGPELVYIKGEHNVVADALSRLDSKESKIPNSPAAMADLFAKKEKVPEDAYPLHFKLIQRYQLADKSLKKLAETDDKYHVKEFKVVPTRGGAKTRPLICREDKICIPSALQKRIADWYHYNLCHPGENRTEQTLRQHFYWRNMRDDVHDLCKKCKNCQLNKKRHQKYGHLPEKEAEVEPWLTLCVDLIGPYEIKRQGRKKALTLQCVTMIDPATGWFEIAAIPNKQADTVANAVETTWLTRYPWPKKIIYDKGKEFMAEFASMVKNDYGIMRRGTTTRNPQANAVLERVHQTIGNIIRSQRVQE